MVNGNSKWESKVKKFMLWIFLNHEMFRGYNQILDILTKISPCRVVTLITNCMIKDILNNAGDTIYLMLINQLIELNKIKIIKKDQNHLQDIIKEKIED